ncbi:YcgJ family protein [Brucella anthropi]|uniref:YcgJ family protein n=1 Tax=Brucella anthropi TaxID=529 RepID=UPI0023611FBF|nr:YcgJ family protein [Brucella anthropi]
MRQTASTILLAFATVTAALPASAATDNSVRFPDKGVLCDATFCADRQGISNGLTAQYLGQEAASKLAAQGDFDRTRFTLSNGIFCDTHEQRCYRDRYTDPRTGKRSPVALLYTGKLFGGPVLPHRPRPR